MQNTEHKDFLDDAVKKIFWAMHPAVDWTRAELDEGIQYLEDYQHGRIMDTCAGYAADFMRHLTGSDEELPDSTEEDEELDEE